MLAGIEGVGEVGLQEWEIEERKTGIDVWFACSLAVFCICLFFAACAVGAAVLYNTCNCYKPPTKSGLLTIARLSSIAAVGHACGSAIIAVPFVGLLQMVFLMVAISAGQGNYTLSVMGTLGFLLFAALLSILPISAFVFWQSATGVKHEFEMTPTT